MGRESCTHDTKEEHTGRSLPQLEEAKWPVAEATEGGAHLYLVLLSLVSELGVSGVMSCDVFCDIRIRHWERERGKGSEADTPIRGYASWR